jgi:hypothetical protein
VRLNQGIRFGGADLPELKEREDQRLETRAGIHHGTYCTAVHPYARYVTCRRLVVISRH